MLINKLSITSFRSIESMNITLSNRNLFLGSNAAGKTSILESIYCLAFTKSYKAKQKSILNINSDFLKVEASTTKGLFKLIDTSKSSKVSVNNVLFEKKVDYIGKLLVVLFSPSDLELVSAEPSEKRKWLNMTLGASNKDYLEKLTIYNKVLKQRNLILKGDQDDLQLDILSKQLSQLNDYLVNIRREFINKINVFISFYNLKISNGLDNVNIEYVYQDNLYEKLQSRLEYDKLTKTTNYGIQRDNLVFKINELEAKEYSSQGQIRSLLLSLTLSVVKYYRENQKEVPILLLDDVFNELDEKRTHSFFESIDEDVQVLMTSTDLKSIVNLNLEDVTIFNIENGRLKNEG